VSGPGQPASGPGKPELVSGPIYVATFDAFRGAAVLAIAVYHLFIRSEWVPTGELPRAFLTSGFMSLDLLFLISGFVMFLPVAARGTLGDLRAFALRRVARIAPAYYVSLLVLIAVWPLVTNGPVPGPEPWEPLPLLWHVLFLQNEVALGYPAYFPGFAVNPALWTLSVEMVFYVVLVIVAGAYLRRPWLGLAIGIAVTVCWRLALDPPHDYFQNAFAPSDLHLIWKQFPLFAVDFAAGMTAAWALVRLRRGVEPERARRLGARRLLDDALARPDRDRRCRLPGTGEPRDRGAARIRRVRRRDRLRLAQAEPAAHAPAVARAWRDQLQRLPLPPDRDPTLRCVARLPDRRPSGGLPAARRSRLTGLDRARLGVLRARGAAGQALRAAPVEAHPRAGRRARQAGGRRSDRRSHTRVRRGAASRIMIGSSGMR
jgi:hypothetical protein